MDDTRLPNDDYSKRLRAAKGNPSAVERSSTIELEDFLGNAETWTVKTIRVDGNDVVFLQRMNAEGGSRWVLPTEVTAVIARQRDSAVAVNRRAGARRAAATRRAK
jgi:hypothetical protein